MSATSPELKPAPDWRHSCDFCERSNCRRRSDAAKSMDVVCCDDFTDVLVAATAFRILNGEE